jgi:hypothetical protein
MSQDIKCAFGLHKYEILEEKELKTSYGIVVGSVIISRCSNCGNIKKKVIYTDTSQR